MEGSCGRGNKKSVTLERCIHESASLLLRLEWADSYTWYPESIAPKLCLEIPRPWIVSLGAHIASAEARRIIVIGGVARVAELKAEPSSP